MPSTQLSFKSEPLQRRELNELDDDLQTKGREQDERGKGLQGAEQARVGEGYTDKMIYCSSNT